MVGQPHHTARHRETARASERMRSVPSVLSASVSLRF
jgi:hypothetical protein